MTSGQETDPANYSSRGQLTASPGWR